MVELEVILDDVLRPSSRRSPLKMQVSNDTGSITLVFFNKIHSFIYSKLRVGQKYTISGKVEIYGENIQIIHPDFIFKKQYSAPIMPIYPLTYGIVNKQLYSYIVDGINVLEQGLKINNFFDYKDYFDNLLLDVKKLHYLDVQDIPTQNINSLKSLAFRELFANQASLAKFRIKEHKNRGRSFSTNKILQNNILAKLGFTLTEGQLEAVEDINKDQSSSFQMIRLLQGDVGCGKTLVALLTMLNVVSFGAQVALMVPSDLLSMQHYQFFAKTLDSLDIKVALLTGKTTTKQKQKIKSDLINGNINILIGTHALFQENVEFYDLGYVIIDEQHKFGVAQRLELINKASNPDVLVMTATPIPRSLTLTMFGDMDVSQIKTKPSNRLPIITSIVSSDKIDFLAASLDKKLQLGEKIYWVCPLVDNEDSLISDRKNDDANNVLQNGNNNQRKLSNVASRFEYLEQIYPGKVSMIHGKLKGSIKDKIMQEFKDSDKNILVATTVIEVGIDVPKASLIIIEDAQQFGLAQAHQLRGRVGRSNLQSHCILMYNPKRLSNMAKQRLQIMRRSDDGFYIAEQDLLLRGGGEILGTRQSGEPVFFFADIARDSQALVDANKLAKNLNFDDFLDFQINLFSKTP